MTLINFPFRSCSYLNFNLWKVLKFQIILFSVYDSRSIMHYGGSRTDCLKFSNIPYMTLNSNGRTVPENKELSIQDIQTLRRFYAPPANVRCFYGINVRSRCFAPRSGHISAQLLWKYISIGLCVRDVSNFNSIHFNLRVFVHSYCVRL